MPKSNSRGRTKAGDELVFVIDVTAFTPRGYKSVSVYEGHTVDLEFDNGTDGLILGRKMASRLGVGKGASLTVVVEGDSTTVVQTRLWRTGNLLRMSDSRIYQAVGSEGGAVLRIRKTN